MKKKVRSFIQRTCCLAAIHFYNSLITRKYEIKLSFWLFDSLETDLHFFFFFFFEYTLQRIPKIGTVPTFYFIHLFSNDAQTILLGTLQFFSKLCADDFFEIVQLLIFLTNMNANIYVDRICSKPYGKLNTFLWICKILKLIYRIQSITEAHIADKIKQKIITKEFCNIRREIFFLSNSSMIDFLHTIFYMD